MTASPSRTRTAARRLAGLLAMWLAGAALAGAHAEGGTATLELRDGSQIRGRVESLEDGVYTVRSEALGRVELDVRDVVALRYGPAAPAGQGPGPTAAGSRVSPAQVEAIASRLLSDPRLVSMIQSLAEDAQMRAVLDDPEIRSALGSGDLQRLMDNPKIRGLMDHDTVRAITSEVR